MYMRIHDKLDMYALNYVTVFLNILKKYYKISDNKISAHLIANNPAMRQDAHRYSYHGRRQFNADTHTPVEKKSLTNVRPHLPDNV